VGDFASSNLYDASNFNFNFCFYSNLKSFLSEIIKFYFCYKVKFHWQNEEEYLLFCYRFLELIIFMFR